jgi:PAS domain S-box-containing protein
MSWVIFFWAMLIGGCVILALPHLYVGIWQRRGAHLFFVLAAAGIIWTAIGELFAMRSLDLAHYIEVRRWTYLPVSILVVGLVGFIQLYLRTGRLWLGVTACILRFATLVVAFTSPPGINFPVITGVRRLHFLGETVAAPIGLVNFWTALSELSSLMLLIFVVDASIRCWRLGTAESHRRAAVIGGSTALFVLLAAGLTALTHRQIIVIPYVVSFPFAAILLAMAFELGLDVVRVGQVTLQLQASRASLVESEGRFLAMANAAPVMIWMSAPDKLCTFFNKAWLEFTGRTMEQERGNGWIEGVHPEDLDKCTKTYITAFGERKAFTMQYRLKRHDGVYRVISDSGTPRYKPGGIFNGYIGACVDVTDVLQQEKALHRAEAEAQQRREEVVRLSRINLLGEMTASIAHELNQPLSGITSNAGAVQRLIDRGSVDLGELREINIDIAADARRASEIIRRIRNTIKKGAAIRERIDLNEMVTKVERMVQPDARLHSCKLKMSLERNLPPIAGDPVEIQQVLINLTTNALDSMLETPLSERKVEISTGHEDGVVNLSVRDHGAGISEEARERLFEQFFTTKKDGLGMGLAIVRSIIESHGGKIAAENVDGGGARFCLKLPMSKGVVEMTSANGNRIRH